MSNRGWGPPVLLIVLMVSGCSNSPPFTCYPVSGKVTLEGAPLPAAEILFLPDAAKGNSSKLTATGVTDAQGTFNLRTSDVKGLYQGAAAGWYKITINTNVPTQNPSTPVAIHARYNDAEKSGLSVEVVARSSPGAYDLKLTR